MSDSLRVLAEDRRRSLLFVPFESVQKCRGEEVRAWVAIDLGRLSGREERLSIAV